MRRPANLLWGAFLVLFGCVLLGWVAFNLFVERLPATEGHSPYPAIGLGGGAIAVGLLRIRRGLGKDR